MNNLNAFNIKWAVNKWKQRMEKTKLTRIRMKRLKDKFFRIRLFLVFNALKVQFFNAKEFLKRMANFANINDH